ncbi:MAG TPA: hypothetical protein PKY46_00580 [Ignavibacteriaceae bacterium]|nr:hypothetical protein [Ignavibacteriaceae bacterium]
MFLVKILDFVRIGLVALAFYFGYSIGFENDYDPNAQLHFMIPIIIVAVAGISGLEGLLMPEKAAKIKGYEVGSNYQRQSAIALLSYAFTAIIIYYANWGTKAELTIFFAFIFFFFFSGVNHFVDAVKRKNYKWQNINRLFIVLLLMAGMVYPVYMAVKLM